MLAARKDKELRSEEERRLGLKAQVIHLKVKGQAGLRGMLLGH